MIPNSKIIRKQHLLEKKHKFFVKSKILLATAILGKVQETLLSSWGFKCMLYAKFAKPFHELLSIAP